MKKILLSIVGVCLFAVTSAFAFKLPQDDEGSMPQSIQDIGVKVLTVGHATTSGSVRGSSVAIYGVMTSTGVDSALSSFVLIRSTNFHPAVSGFNATNNSGELLVPEIVVATTTRNTFLEFDPPIICPSGFEVQVTTPRVIVAVFYQYMSTVGAGGNRDRYLIPRDDYQRQKVYSASLYGVKVASVVTPGATAGDASGTENYDATSSEVVVYGSTPTSWCCVGDSTITINDGEVRGFLYGFMASTGSVTNYVVFRDTNSTGNAAYNFLPPIFYNALSDEDINYGGRKNANFRFPWPVIFERGLTQTRDQADDKFRIFAKPAEKLY